MRISRIYNNNVALTRDSCGQDAVVIGRGLAFGKRKGDLIDPNKVEQTFIPEHDISAERLSWSLSEIPPEILAIASELETKVRNTPDIKIANSFIIPFADHLHYAVARAREGLQVDYPLAPEVTLLYPREVEFGRRALDLVHERLHLTLDPQEAIPLALHLVNAQFATADMSRAFRMTEVFAQVFDVIGATYGKPIDTNSMSAARFITHLRYLFVRADRENNKQQRHITQPGVLAALRADAPQAFACAQKVLLLLEMQLNQPLRQDELTYLTIHIDRLAQEMWGS